MPLSDMRIVGVFSLPVAWADEFFILHLYQGSSRILMLRIREKKKENPWGFPDDVVARHWRS